LLDRSSAALPRAAAAEAPLGDVEVLGVAEVALELEALVLSGDWRQASHS
jgi:hypothetical protein